MQARINEIKKHLTTVYLPGCLIVTREWTEIPPHAEQAARDYPYLETRDTPKPVRGGKVRNHAQKV